MKCVEIVNAIKKTLTDYKGDLHPMIKNVNIKDGSYWLELEVGLRDNPYMPYLLLNYSGYVIRPSDEEFLYRFKKLMGELGVRFRQPFDLKVTLNDEEILDRYMLIEYDRGPANGVKGWGQVCFSNSDVSVKVVGITTNPGPLPLDEIMDVASADKKRWHKDYIIVSGKIQIDTPRLSISGVGRMEIHHDQIIHRRGKKVTTLSLPDCAKK